jgi:hypothetical protein
LLAVAAQGDLLAYRRLGGLGRAAVLTVQAVLVLGMSRQMRWRLLLAEYAAAAHRLLEQQARQVLVAAQCVATHLAIYHGLQALRQARQTHRQARPVEILREARGYGPSVQVLQAAQMRVAYGGAPATKYPCWRCDWRDSAKNGPSSNLAQCFI